MLRDKGRKSMGRLYNRLRRGIIAGSLLAVMVSSVCVMPQTLQAKTKVTTKKLTMTVGGKKRLHSPRTAGRTVYKSSDRKTATVSRKGVVTAKKKGKCVITARLSKRRYKFILTIKKKRLPHADDAVNTGEPSAPSDTLQPQPGDQEPAATPSEINEKTLADNIDVKGSMLSSGKRLYIVTNNNPVQIDSVRLNVMYYNNAGMPIKSGEVSLKYLDPSEKRYIVAATNVEGADYLKTTVGIKCSCSQNTVKSKVPVSVSAKADPEDKTILATIANSGTGGCSFRCVCLFKDSEGKILDAREIKTVLKEGETRSETIMAPYKITSYEPIEYSEYELIYYAVGN